MIPWQVAYAEVPDGSEPGLRLVVLCAGVAVAAAVLALIPVGIATSRRSRWFGPVTLASLLWAVVAAGQVLYASIHRLNWEREQSLRLQSGYYDPADRAGEPVPPQWLVFGTAYAMIVAAAFVPMPRHSDPAAR